MTLISMSFDLKQVLHISGNSNLKTNFTDGTSGAGHSYMHFVNEGKTHVSIPRGLFSTVTMAELTSTSSIFFAATSTVSLGSTVTILTSHRG